MKTTNKAAAIVILIMAAVNAFGQIPNNGFENWTNKGNYMIPDGWWTPNDSVKTGSFYPVTRSADHYPTAIGNYSIRLENNIGLLPDWDAFGLTWTGDFNGNNFPVFPVTNHPTSLWGYYKFFPQNNDTMELHIRLYKNGMDVSGGSFKTAVASAVWTAFSMNFSTYVDADSARIFISTCYDNDAPIPHGNSVLYIDNLSLDSLITVGIHEVNLDKEISVFPIPASNVLTIMLSEDIGNLTGLAVFNTFGQRIYAQVISQEQKLSALNVSQLAEGIYFIHLTLDNQVVCAKKIIIAR